MDTLDSSSSQAMDEAPPSYASAIEEAPAAVWKQGEQLQPGYELTAGDPPPPPTYQASNNEPPQYTNDPPPSYDTVILGKVQKVREESSGNADFAKRMLCMACCGTTCTVIFIAVCIAFPLASLIIGSIYIHDCPRERYIPIFLIVSGVFGILRAISSSIHTILNRKREAVEEGNEEQKANPFDGVVGCFLFGWGIAGSVWVYRIHKDYQSVDPAEEDYCNNTLYLYAFWSLTVGYICVLLTICCGCGCGCLAMCAVGSQPRQPKPLDAEANAGAAAGAAAAVP